MLTYCMMQHADYAEIGIVLIYSNGDILMD